jgi:hypothetical protein
MQKLRLNDLSDPVRDFLAPASKGEVIVVEDEAGSVTYSVIPVVHPSSEQKRQAWNRILRLQQKVGESMRRQGVSEDDIDRVLRDEE